MKSKLDLRMIRTGVASFAAFAAVVSAMGASSMAACPARTTTTATTATPAPATQAARVQRARYGTSVVTGGAVQAPATASTASVYSNNSAAFTPLPVVDASAVVTARLATSASRTDLSRAITIFNRAVRQIERNFASQPDVADATHAVADAQAEYDAAIEPAMAELREREDYRAAQLAAVAAQDRLDELKANTPDSIESRLAAAQSGLSARQLVASLKQEVLDSNPQVLAARQKLDDAAGTLAALRKQYDDAVTADPAYASAQSDVDAKRAQLAGAAESLLAARRELAKQKAARTAAIAHPQQNNAVAFAGGPPAR